MSRSFSLGSKVAAAVLVFALGYAVSITLGTVGDLHRQGELGALSGHAVPGALAAREARFVFDAAVASHSNAMLTGEATELTGVTSSAARVAALLAEIEGHLAAQQDDTSALLIAIADLKAFVAESEPLFSAVLAKGMADPEVQKRVAAFNELVKKNTEGLAALDKAIAGHLTENLTEMQTASGHARNVNLIVFGLSIFLGGVCAWGLARFHIVRPVLGLSAKLGDESEGVRAAASQFEQASVSLSDGASRSAAALETSSAALEQISGVTAANAERAEQARGLSTRARDAAEAGSAGMAELSEAMAAIRAASDNIAAILKTIDEIAFQTNILALNAAVEAARAGEAGAGFAVVADEVRSLAQRSAAAARDTASKIEDAQRRSAKGAELTGKVEANLGDIVGRVREVADIITEIASASAEQRSGLSQVAGSVSDLDKLTQQNAALAQETSASANELTSRIDALRGVAEALDRLVKGGATPA